MPIYTYRCAAGHEWTEVRTVEGSEMSEDKCGQCQQTLSETEALGLLPGQLLPHHGRKVPSLVGRVDGNFTPKFYPGRD